MNILSYFYLEVLRVKVTFKTTGGFRKTKQLLSQAERGISDATLSKYGEKGVRALQEATPKASGKTADSWSYKIEKTKNGKRIVWTNSNEVNGVNIAVILQYGHGTKNGLYVRGRDYINPAMKPMLDEMTEEIWGEIK